VARLLLAAWPSDRSAVPAARHWLGRSGRAAQNRIAAQARRLDEQTSQAIDTDRDG
jgi:hypothetical protein